MASLLAAQVHDALPSSPSSVASAAWRLVFVSHSDLPPSLQVLPTLFRLLAVALFVPVAALAVVDIVGWAAFKLVLRPLGYASTRHFKDPEKDARLVAVPLRGSTHSPSSTCEGVLPSSGESTSSGASDIFPSPAFSDSTPLPPVDEGGTIRAGRSPALAAIVTSASASSSSSSSPSSSSSSGTSSPHRGRVSSHPRVRTSSLRLSQDARRASPPSSTASPSESGDESSTARQMRRDRAPSVGLDGPLFGEGDETDTATTPGAESDAESLSSASTEKLPGDYLSHKPVRGDGVPHGGFKLGLTEVQRRPGTEGSA
ncbi:hypothetical protein JCM10450v2_004640 [Rhodotorula kratochvilovae]